MELTADAIRTVEVPLVPEEEADVFLAMAPRLRLVDVGTGVPEGPPTEVSFAASPVCFHLLVEVASEPPLLVAVPDGGPVFEDECVELFFADPREPFVYREVVVNPAGSRYGAEVRNPDDSRATWTLRPGSLPEGLRAAVSGGPAGRPPSEWSRWRCRLSVPWRALSADGAPPRDGAARRLNVYRIGRGAVTLHLALSPTLRGAPPDFHVPSRFARALFRAAGRIPESC